MKNQCMGCQAGWPMVSATSHTVVGGYPHERVGCTAHLYQEPVNPVTWPLTAEFLRVYEKEQAAAAMPTLRWAYGAMLDKSDSTRVERLVWLSEVRRAAALGVNHGAY